MNRHYNIASVVHGVATVFWAGCILAAPFALLFYCLLSSGGIHGFNAFDILDFIRFNSWPLILRAAFVIGGTGALVDAILRLRNRRKRK